MRRSRKNSIKKERVIMIASTAFVLAALTMVGIYVKDKSAKVDDGYTIDFTALEDNVGDKYQEIASNTGTGETSDPSAAAEESRNNSLEVGSSLIEIPGVTDQEKISDNELAGLTDGYDPDDILGNAELDSSFAEEEDTENDETEEETSSTEFSNAVTLSFSEAEGLTRPSAGEIILPYSMESSIYFATLDQYKYHPAVVFTAIEGDLVNAGADGKVISIFQNEEIGLAVTLDLGDGYKATYGQLKDVQVSEGSYVDKGDALASVKAATKYYSAEGTNLYFQLTKDGTPVNPEGLFK